MAFNYVVQTELNQRSDEWIDFMKNKHFRDIFDTGLVMRFSLEEIAEIDGNPVSQENPQFMVRYTFFSKEDFKKYAEEHGPRLKQDYVENCGKYTKSAKRITSNIIKHYEDKTGAP